MLPRCYNLLSCLFFTAVPALANDSTAELETGGLVLRKSSDIEMLSEDLFISTQEIKIHYVFRNNSTTDVSTVIAFPQISPKRWHQECNLDWRSERNLEFVDQGGAREILR